MKKTSLIILSSLAIISTLASSIYNIFVQNYIFATITIILLTINIIILGVTLYEDKK